MSRRLSLTLLVLWPAAAALISFWMNAGFVWGMGLFLFVPAAFLTYIYPRATRRSALFAAIFCLPTAIITDYIMEATNAWHPIGSLFGDMRLVKYDVQGM